MAQLVKGIMLPMQHQEQLIFMDIFGKRQDVFLNISGGPTRADKITSTLAAMTDAETQTTTYATANNHDLTADLAAGAEALAKLQASLQ